MKKHHSTDQKVKDSWTPICVGDIFSFVKSYALSRDELINEILSDKIGNIHYGDIHSTYKTPSIDVSKIQIPVVRKHDLNPNKDDLLRDGDLIMVDASEDYEGVGSTISIHGLKGKKAVGGLHTFVLRDKSGLTDEYYRQYIFCNPEVRNRLQKIANGISVYSISKREVTKLLLKIPSMDEQKRIALILQSWDKAICVLEKKIEIKKKIKSGLTWNLLTGKKRLAGFEGKWQEKKFGDLFSERNERGRANLPLLSITSDRGVIYQSESNKKDTSNADKSKYLRICPGDIGYNTMRMWQGRSALSKIEGLVSPAYTILSPKKEVDSRYFAYLFKLPRVVNYFLQKSQGLVSDTLQCRYKDFSIVRYKVPDYKEQIAIADILETLDKNISDLEKKLARLQDQKKYLLNNLITGKIRTPETLSAKH